MGLLQGAEGIPLPWFVEYIPFYLQEEVEPQPLLPRVSQDMIALRLAQEKALKRQLEEEQKLKQQQQQQPPRPVVPAAPLPTEESMDFREEVPEAETPTIFISMQEEEESFGGDNSLLDSSLEGPWPSKVPLLPFTAVEGFRVAGIPCQEDCRPCASATPGWKRHTVSF